jgi:glycosyltransferase involved in cell wall biosynthesis
MDISADQINALSIATLHPALAPHKLDEMPSISVVAPAYNEEEVLGEFHRRVTAVLVGLGCAYEIVLVNDGSRDNTLSLMHALRAQDPHVTVVDLSRNFGKEIA